VAKRGLRGWLRRFLLLHRPVVHKLKTLHPAADINLAVARSCVQKIRRKLSLLSAELGHVLRAQRREDFSGRDVAIQRGRHRTMVRSVEVGHELALERFRREMLVHADVIDPRAVVRLSRAARGAPASEHVLLLRVEVAKQVDEKPVDLTGWACSVDFFAKQGVVATVVEKAVHPLASWAVVEDNLQ